MGVATAQVSQVRVDALLDALIAKTQAGGVSWTPSDLEDTYVAANTNFSFVADEFKLSVTDHSAVFAPIGLRTPRARVLVDAIREVHRDREEVIQRAIDSLG